jgi:hypothetical protein
MPVLRRPVEPALLNRTGCGPAEIVGHEIDGPGVLPTHKHCNGPKPLQKVNFGGLQFEPKAVARVLQVALLYRVEWAGRLFERTLPDGTTAD